jgi:hypothetical protein
LQIPPSSLQQKKKKKKKKRGEREYIATVKPYTKTQLPLSPSSSENNLCRSSLALYFEDKMVSKRQKLARKIYKEDHPELFPKPEPTPPNDPNKMKKKKKSLFKRKNSDPKDPNKANKKGFRKQPLRVPGMKPGDSCFICKAKDHIAKLCPQKDEWEKNKVCSFYCFWFIIL